MSYSYLSCIIKYNFCVHRLWHGGACQRFCWGTSWQQLPEQRKLWHFASRENRKFISTESPHKAISKVCHPTKNSIDLKTWAAVRRSSCRPRSILISGQHVREPDKIGDSDATIVRALNINILTLHWPNRNWTGLTNNHDIFVTFYLLQSM